MSTKRKSTKTPKRATPKKSVTSTEGGLAVATVDPDKFTAAPRRRRSSQLDAMAKKLLEVGKGTMVTVKVPTGTPAKEFRSYVYSQLKRSLQYFNDGKLTPVAIKIADDGLSLGAQLK